jgi:predicted Zn-dependent peptidase
MAIGIVEALSKLLYSIGSSRDANYIIRIKVRDGSSRTLGELLRIINALTSSVLRHVARERG